MCLSLAIIVSAVVPEAAKAIVFNLHKAYLLIIILYTVFKNH